MKELRPDPFALRNQLIRSAAAILETATVDWLASAPPSDRPAIEAACSRLTPEVLALLRSLPLETWRQLEALLSTLRSIEGSLSPDAAAAFPFLPPEARAALLRGAP